MILILGNNEYIRHDIWLSVFMKKYIVTEFPIEEMECITKPFMTVYLNPTTEQLQKIKNEDTICVVAKNNMPSNPPAWMKVIPFGNPVAKDLMRIYNESCTFGKGREIFGVIGIEGKKFTYGGAYIHMTPNQLNAIKILIYNPNKKFTLYDISSYFKFNGDREECFMKMVDEINHQCKRARREKLICNDAHLYYINPSVLEY